MLTDLFMDKLAERPYCSDDLELYGLQIREKDRAIRSKLIQFNTPVFANFLSFDIDSETAGIDWYDAGGPPPNFVMQNPRNGHAHYLYALKSPVCVSGNARTAPMRYLASIERALTHRLSADKGYSGLIVKNPLNDQWRTWSPTDHRYSLGDLWEYCDPQHATRPVRDREVRGIGRNCDLFDMLRFWAYDNVERARAESTEQDWMLDVTARAVDLNANFSVPLVFNEMSAVARSVAKWTWRHYDAEHDGKNRGALGYGSTRHDDMTAMALTDDEKRERQRAGVRYTNSIRKTTTEAKIKQAVEQLRLDGKKLTVASVSRIAGVHRNTVTRHYKHLLV